MNEKSQMGPWTDTLIFPLKDRSLFMGRGEVLQYWKIAGPKTFCTPPPSSQDRVQLFMPPPPWMETLCASSPPSACLKLKLPTLKLPQKCLPPSLLFSMVKTSYSSFLYFVGVKRDLLPSLCVAPPPSR